MAPQQAWVSQEWGDSAARAQAEVAHTQAAAAHAHAQATAAHAQAAAARKPLWVANTPDGGCCCCSHTPDAGGLHKRSTRPTGPALRSA